MNRTLESSSLRVAILAIHGLSALRLERNFAFLATFRTCCLMHFSRPKIAFKSAAAFVKISHVVFLLVSTETLLDFRRKPPERGCI